jgi:hypothetical protein
VLLGTYAVLLGNDLDHLGGHRRRGPQSASHRRQIESGRHRADASPGVAHCRSSDNGIALLESEARSQPRPQDLTSRERQLVDKAAAGETLVCSDLFPERLSAINLPQYSIRAKLLRDVLLNRCDKRPDPRDGRVRAAHIIGPLDFAHIRPEVGIELSYCSFDDEAWLQNAHLPWLNLTDSRISDRPWLNFTGPRP